MNPASVLSENQLLMQLPTNSRIVSPSGKVLLKCPDGRWCNLTASGVTNAYLQAGHTGSIPAGSLAYFPNEPRRPCYVKHPDGNWLDPSSTGGPSAGNHLHNQPPAGPSTTLQILPHTLYRRGPAPVDHCLVLFNVYMSEAESGQVPDLDMPAYSGELAAKEKATIRFNLLEEGAATGYKPKQCNLQRYGEPIMRGQLAQSIAEELRRLLAALDEVGRPLRSPSGRRLAFEDVILVDVRRVSQGSLQPTLATRIA
ncbi:hypothetical protein GSI_04825 [Ganoderma sinense ZZ0214-1]|uniref:Uncharacterized protein n=1 Tax=Ganoderma sinense ZZ0214-1 TaxID=1077348 RepID=A0A2G8SG10_9APHY|nr:hypothetical protein GSI_04825 [Ganoderma sinense ZZ0214-1]